jgi:tetratricopeptide (TPR) repeat protein
MKICRNLLSFVAAISAFLLSTLIVAAQPSEPTTAQAVQEIERLDFANGLLSRDFYQEAMEEFDRFLGDFPASDLKEEAIFGKAECLFFLKQYDQALEIYQSYLTDFPQGTRREVVLLRCGQGKIFLNQPPQALEFFRKINESAIGEKFLSEYLFYLGKAYQGIGNGKEALVYLQRAVDLPVHSLTYEAYFEIVEIHLIEGHPQQALKVLEMIDNGPEDSVWKSLAALKRGEILFIERQYENALAIFQDIVERYHDQPVMADALANIFLSYFNLQRFEDITQEFENGRYPICEQENSVPVYITVGSAHGELGQIDRAQAVLDKALGFPDLTAESWRKIQLKKAEIWIKAQEWKKALDILDAIKAQNTTSGERELILVAEVYYRMGQFREAIDLYREFLKNYPDSTLRDDALYGMGYAYASSGHRIPAIQKLREYFEQGRDMNRRAQAMEFAIKLSNSDPQDNAQTLQLGETYLQTLEPAYQNPLVVWQLAGCYAKAQRFEDANHVLETFLKNYPEHERKHDAEFQLAYNYHMAEHWQEAMAGYQAIVDRVPEHPYKSAALKNIGLLYYKQGQTQKAKEIFLRLMTQMENPDLDLETYFWLAEDYIKEKRFADAELVLKRVDGKPMHAEQNSQFSYLLAEAYRGQNQYEEAIRYYDQALTILVDQDIRAMAAIARGICYKELQQWRMARQVLEQILQENITNHKIAILARFEIAEVERLQSHWDQAARAYMLIAVLYQDETYCPKALWEAGQIFERMAEGEKAVKAYQEIVDRYPQSAYASPAAEMLKNF